MLIQRFVLVLIAWLSARVVCLLLPAQAPTMVRIAPTTHNKRLLVNVGQKLTGGVFASIRVTGISMCAKECLLRGRCKTFGYNVNTLLCELGDNLSATESISDVRRVVGNPSDWDKNETLAGQCARHNCQTGHRCVELTSRSQPVCVLSECADPPSRRHTITSFNSSERTVGSVVNYGMCTAGKNAHGQQSITCLANGQWSSYDYACCDCDTSYTVIVDCECSIIRGPKKSYSDAIDHCDNHDEQFTVISSADQLQRLSGIATSETIRIYGKYYNSKWIAGNTELDWIDDLPYHLKVFSSDPESLAFKKIGNEVVLVDITYSTKKNSLCKLL